MLNQAQASGIYFLISLGFLLHSAAWLGYWVNNKKELLRLTQYPNWKRWRMACSIFALAGVFFGLISAFQSASHVTVILYLITAFAVEVAAWAIIYFIRNTIYNKRA